MTRASQDILMTFTGFHDPFYPGLVDGQDQPGPVMSLLSAKTFDHIFLFETPATRVNTEDTIKAIHEKYPESSLEKYSLDISDPTEYRQILSELRKYYQIISDLFQDVQYYISVASGTPQMHASLLLLTASGEIPAKILHIRPPRFVTKDKPLISEIDLTSPEFPTIRFQNPVLPVQETDTLDISVIKEELGIIGDHPVIMSCLETGCLLAPTEAPVLIYGETGTGKELLARFIHRISLRNPFIPVNCAAIPETLVESILFGHKKGSFTGAFSDQAGKFEQAHNGTLFLDEIGELPLSIQSKLLRVLQDGIIERVGETQGKKVNVRIIGATNRNLKKLVKQRKFREDLFFRLNVGEIYIPPLRERRSDITKIALSILDTINKSVKQHKRISPDALSRLQSHSWPGNVRDLGNVIERSVLLSKTNVLMADDLLITEPITYADPFEALPYPYEGFSIEEFIKSIRKQLILRALEAANGNQSKAARMLGITPQAVYKFLQKDDNI